MKGDKKTNKAIELLHSLYFRDDFMQDLEQTRQILKIPKKGFKNMKYGDNLKWIKDKKTAVNFNKMTFSFMKKYSIPHRYHWVFQEYLQTGKLETRQTGNEQVAFIDPTAHKAEFPLGLLDYHYRASGEPFVKLFIFGNNSKTDVKNFIDKYWKNIEDSFLEQGCKLGKRVRKTINKDRDILIIKLSKKPIKELRKKLERKGGEVSKSDSKEDIISKLLILERPKPFRAKSGYIRKIIQKYRNKKI
jgi:hypothetical protein